MQQSVMFSSARLTTIINGFCALFGDVTSKAAEASVLDLDEFESVGRLHFHEFVASREPVGVFATAVARVDWLGRGRRRSGRVVVGRVRSCGGSCVDVQLASRGRRRRGAVWWAHGVGLFDLAESGVDYIQELEEVRRVGGLDERLCVSHPHPKVVLHVPGEFADKLLEDVVGVEAVPGSRVSE